MRKYVILELCVLGAGVGVGIGNNLNIQQKGIDCVTKGDSMKWNPMQSSEIKKTFGIPPVQKLQNPSFSEKQI